MTDFFILVRAIGANRLPGLDGEENLPELGHMEAHQKVEDLMNQLRGN